MPRGGFRSKRLPERIFELISTAPAEDERGPVPEDDDVLAVRKNHVQSVEEKVDMQLGRQYFDNELPKTKRQASRAQIAFLKITRGIHAKVMDASPPRPPAGIRTCADQAYMALQPWISDPNRP